MHELVDQARLPYARLADQRHHLAMTRPGLLQHLLERRQLLLPSDEARQPPRRAGLQAPAERTDPRQLEDLYGLGQPLDRKPSQRLDLDQAFGQSKI